MSSTCKHDFKNETFRTQMAILTTAPSCAYFTCTCIIDQDDTYNFQIIVGFSLPHLK